MHYSEACAWAYNGSLHVKPLWLRVFVRAICYQVPERRLAEGVSFLNPTELPLFPSLMGISSRKLKERDEEHNFLSLCPT